MKQGKLSKQEPLRSKRPSGDLRGGGGTSRRPCTGTGALEDWISGWGEHSYSSVWQQRTNTPLLRWIASLMETKTVKMPTWENTISLWTQVSHGRFASGLIYWVQQASQFIIFQKQGKWVWKKVHAVLMLYFFLSQGVHRFLEGSGINKENS